MIYKKLRCNSYKSKTQLTHTIILRLERTSPCIICVREDAQLAELKLVASQHRSRGESSERDSIYTLLYMRGDVFGELPNN